MTVSIIIPVGPAHTALARRAIHSAEQQSYPCNVIIIADKEGNGAGWARNRGAELSKDEFFVFLDADDTIDREFVHKTLEVFAKHGRYVYTDWQRHTKDGTPEHVETPDYAQQILIQYAFFHSVTTLLPAIFWQSVDGFDEALPAWEDNDFYYKLGENGLCGVRLSEILFTYYSEDGTRRRHGYTHRNELRKLLTERYPMAKRSCCGGAPQNQPAQRSKEPFTWQDDDAVEAEFTRGGALAFKGLATQVRYPRKSKGVMFWVHFKDAAAEKNRPGGAYFRALERPNRDIQGAISKLQEKVKNELG